MNIDKLVSATHNTKKLKEMREILLPLGIELVGLDSFPGAPEPVEDGDSFEANAVIKAVSALEYTGLPSLADDSGLMIDALDGAPGVYSARYAGENGGDVENRQCLLRNMKNVPCERRSAKFVSVITLAVPGGDIRSFRGETYGVILDEERGHSGFGYDPLFFSDDLGMTFAEAKAEEKNRVSHRGRAMAKLFDFLKA